MIEDSYCDIYKNPSVSAFGFSLLITVGIALSYLPQYFDIYRTRSSIGIAPTFLLLISIAAVSATTNLVLLSYFSVPCCSVISGFECLNSQMSLIQVGTQGACTLLITWFCVHYTDESKHEPKSEREKLVKVWSWILIYVAAAAVTIVVAYVVGSSKFILGFAKFLGLFSTTLTIVQYLPQLYTTYKLKSPGVLSIAMMAIQTPGGFVWTTTLMLKPGANWSSWLPFLTAAIFQGLLLVLCVYYTYFGIPVPLLIDDVETSADYQSTA